MEDRQNRLFIVIFLTFVTWYGINLFIAPKEEPQTGKTPNSTTTQNKSAEDKTKEPSTVEKPSESSKPVELPGIERPKEVSKYHVITSSYLIEFSSMGGKIEKFYVKNYPGLDGNEVKIIKKKEDEITFQDKKYKAIEISRNRGFDFNIIEKMDSIPLSPYNQVNFSSNFDKEKLLLSFDAVSLDGKFLIKKEFQFFEKENYFKFKLKLRNNSTEKVEVSSHPIFLRSFGSLGPVDNYDELDDRHKMHFFRFYYMDGDFEDSVDGKSTDGFFSSLFGGNKKNTDPRFDIIKNANGLEFFGTGSRYFVAALNPLNHKPSGALLDKRDGNQTGILAHYEPLSLNSGEEKVFDFAAYVGIREMDAMTFRNEAFQPIKKDSPFHGLSDKLDKSFNQGLTTPFRNGIVWLLKKMYFLIPNFGWCIILFGILFKVAFYPLNQKQAESMKKMQELKPQIDEINQKYEKDPQLKQQKIMELYKRNNANPMGGCLPMLIQIPIFIALYTAFSDTIDLWKESFLWVNDLSEPDTVFTIPKLLGMTININVLPLIMVGTQVVQTSMTSVSSDPNQKMMMYFMPLIMLYFFWTMPSGVTLYWTIQNVLSIVQQVYTNKFGKGPKIKVMVSQ
ncbi:MAG: membrane protein insertase YidC [Leptospiraceae bacterium]|nr:membrane protein insertase YidC [Leptospiraceae bacterium]MCP5498525.1 membrane protein insertase YidC [Leptospiraceae bacterium]